ncbi:MAG: diguanylate cyclase [Pseudomonadota bacterium]
MPPASDPSRPSGGRLPQQTYLPRAIGLGLGSIGMGLALSDLSRPLWVWVVVGFTALLWPHLAYQRAVRSATPYPAELQNIMLDAGLIGFVVCAAGFNLMPSAIGLTVASMNSMAINGWRLWCFCVLATLAGLAAGLLAMPWVFAPASSLAVQVACLPILALYFPTIGLGTLKLARSLRRSREALRQVGQVDGLSGLFNRRCFEERIAAACELRRMRPSGHPRAALLLLDVDHFKHINDTAGHATGDAVIRHMGVVLKATVRSEDIAARYGGDEFVVLLQDAGQDEAQAFVERMKSTLQHRQRSGDALPAFTLSTGIACYDTSAPTPQSWVARADAALYTVKRRARGGVEISGN